MQIAASDAAYDDEELLSYHDSPDAQAIWAKERAAIQRQINTATPKHVASSSKAQAYVSSIPHVSTAKEVLAKGPKGVTELSTNIKARPSNPQHLTDLLEDIEIEPAPADEPKPIEGLIRLPERQKSLQTLRLLFPFATSDLLGAVHWLDFITTMRDLGFCGEHRGGSEWTFRLSKKQDGTAHNDRGSLNTKQSIVIHQPHPDQRMGAILLQRIGKRLRRRFDWERETFKGL